MLRSAQEEPGRAAAISNMISEKPDIPDWVKHVLGKLIRGEDLSFIDIIRINAPHLSEEELESIDEAP